MNIKQKANELYRLAVQLENAAWDFYCNLDEEEPSVCEPPKPLTYEDLEALLESDEYEEIGICVYVQELPYSVVTVAVLDWFGGEVLAVYGEGLSYRGRDYGKTWVAYLEKPVFDNE